MRLNPVLTVLTLKDSDAPLLHYSVDCRATARLRDAINRLFHRCDRNDIQAVAAVLKNAAAHLLLQAVISHVC